MEKLKKHLLWVILLVILIILQGHRFIYRYDKMIVDNLEVLVRTNIITKQSEMLSPITLEWFDRNDIAQNEIEEEAKRITYLNNEIERYKELIKKDEEEMLSSLSDIQVIFMNRQEIGVKEFIQNEIEKLENQLKEIQNP